jgi:heterodisulfide reductase subunit B
MPDLSFGSRDAPDRAEKQLGEKVDIKILYFTQLLGMALGLKPRKVGVHENISDSMAFLKEKGLG